MSECIRAVSGSMGSQRMGLFFRSWTDEADLERCRRLLEAVFVSLSDRDSMMLREGRHANV